MQIQIGLHRFLENGPIFWNENGTAFVLALLPSPSICQLLANFSGVEFLRSVFKLTKSYRKPFSCVHVSIKRETTETRKFHVVVVRRRQRNVQKSVMHVHSCCFSKSRPIAFCRCCCSALSSSSLLNPLSPKSDQHQMCLCNINAL